MPGRSIRSSIRAVALGSSALLLLSGCAIVSRLVTGGGGPVIVGGSAASCSTFEVAADASGNVSQETIDRTVATIRSRLDSLGAAAASVEVTPPDLLTVSFPAGDDTSWRAAITRPGVVTFVDVPAEFDEQVVEGQRLPDGMDPTPILDGTSIVVAEVTSDQLGKPAISITFDAAGAATFDAYAASHLGRRFAIVVDGIVMSAPAIRATSFGGKAQISGTFSADEAAGIVAAIGSGVLPAALTEVAHGPADADSTCIPTLIIK